MKKISLFPFLLCLLAASGAAAQTPSAAGEAVSKIGLDQKPGQSIPLDLVFQNEEGRPVTLRQFFGGKKPVLLIPVYFKCPMLCSLVLQGTVKALKAMSLRPGRDFTVITYSINPAEDAGLAAENKTRLIKRYGRPEAAGGWHFLTSGGQKEPAEILSDAVGFRYGLDPASGEYAHAAVITLLTPEGRISRYFTGVEFSARDLQFALIEASGGKIGSIIDQMLLRCFHYDPATGRYGLAVQSVLRIAGVLTLAALAGMISLFLIRENHTVKG